VGLQSSSKWDNPRGLIDQSSLPSIEWNGSPSSDKWVASLSYPSWLSWKYDPPMGKASQNSGCLQSPECILSSMWLEICSKKEFRVPSATNSSRRWTSTSRVYPLCLMYTAHKTETYNWPKIIFSWRSLGPGDCVHCFGKIETTWSAETTKC